MAVCPAVAVAEVEPPGAAPKVKSSGAFIVSVSTADVLAAKLVSPEYLAVIEWAPAVREEVLNVAWPFKPTVALPICVVPSRKVTLPVAPLAALDTVAVNVTCCPTTTVTAEDIRRVDVGACWTT